MRERFIAPSLHLSLAWKEWQLSTPVVEEEARAGSSPMTPPTTLDAIAEEDEAQAGTPQAQR